MENRNPEIVEIIDEEKPIFKCKICGAIWEPEMGSGKLRYSYWQCPEGCKL